MLFAGEYVPVSGSFGLDIGAASAVVSVCAFLRGCIFS
jgi:hypothetical protein